MRESSVVNEWMAEGRAEGKAEGKAEGWAEALRDVLEVRFGELPAELVAKLAETHDVNVLRQWTRLAVLVTSLEQFRQAARI
jgi:predicted transposase YdaD